MTDEQLRRRREKLLADVAKIDAEAAPYEEALTYGLRSRPRQPPGAGGQRTYRPSDKQKRDRWAQEIERIDRVLEQRAAEQLRSDVKPV